MKIVYVKLKKRSYAQRIKRLPKLIRLNWKFAKGGKFWERVRFVFEMVKIVMK